MGDQLFLDPRMFLKIGSCFVSLKGNFHVKTGVLVGKFEKL